MIKKLFAILLALVLALTSVGAVLAESPNPTPPNPPAGPPLHAKSYMVNRETGKRVDFPIAVDVHTLGQNRKMARYLINIPGAAFAPDPAQGGYDVPDPTYSVHFSLELYYYEAGAGTQYWRAAHNYIRDKWTIVDSSVSVSNAYAIAQCHGEWWNLPNQYCYYEEVGWVGYPQSGSWYTWYPAALSGTDKYIIVNTVDFIGAYTMATMTRGQTVWDWGFCVAVGGSYSVPDCI